MVVFEKEGMINADLGKQGQQGFLKVVSFPLRPVKGQSDQLNWDRGREGRSLQKSMGDTLWAETQFCWSEECMCPKESGAGHHRVCGVLLGPLDFTRGQWGATEGLRAEE